MAIVNRSMDARFCTTRCKNIMGFLATVYLVILAHRITDNQVLIESLRSEMNAEMLRYENMLSYTNSNMNAINLEKEQQINELQTELENLKSEIQTLKINHEEQLDKINTGIISQNVSIQKYGIQNTDLTLELKNLEKIIAIHKASNRILGKLWSSTAANNRPSETLQFTTDYKVLHRYEKEKIYKNEFEKIEDRYNIINIDTTFGTMLDLEMDGKIVNMKIAMGIDSQYGSGTHITFLESHWS